MDYDYSKLRGRIVEKYGSQSNFANRMNLSDNTVSRKMNSIVGFSREDILKWCDALDIKTKEIGEYFFIPKV